jgi:uncharacterized protein (UPF0332 family)
VINDQNIINLCTYRFDQAKEALCEARLLQEAGHYRGAINRAYYAMFYSLQVLVIVNKVKVSKHSRIISFFDREYVKSGVFDKRFSKWLHRLFDLRQDADYGNMFMPTEDQCREAVGQSMDFVQEIQNHFEKLNKNSP